MLECKCCEANIVFVWFCWQFEICSLVLQIFKYSMDARILEKMRPVAEEHFIPPWLSLKIIVGPHAIVKDIQWTPQKSMNFLGAIAENIYLHIG